MLAIRPAQMEVFGDDARARFEVELRDVFARAYPRETRQAGGPAALLDWVRLGVGAATLAGYRSQYEVGRWLSLMLILGCDFAIDPQLPWVHESLEPAVEPDPAERIERLFEQTLDYLGATAGQSAERVVRAMLRIRASDFGAVPALQGAAAVDDACARLRALYPEKFAFQGADLTARNVVLQHQRAREFGLRGPAGQFLFVALSFMLGSGFDHDPLHPWASAILHGPASDDADDRAATLEAAARAHLATSLSKD